MWRFCLENASIKQELPQPWDDPGFLTDIPHPPRLILVDETGCRHQ